MATEAQKQGENAATGREASGLNEGLAIFHASYYWSGGYGAYDEANYVIVANSINEALGFALEAEPDTKANDWAIIEIDATKAGATHISERSS
jgi:hypothetical protein